MSQEEKGHDLTPSKRRDHALLPRRRGEAGEPFLPSIGQIYQINTSIYSFGTDRAAERPAVVISVPPSPDSQSPIQVATRTSNTKDPGIQHPADKELQLDRAGVFSDLASIERNLWRPENVTLVGTLPEPYLTQVLGRFS